jgi:Tfp pilus assembly protein PilN
MSKPFPGPGLAKLLAENLTRKIAKIASTGFLFFTWMLLITTISSPIVAQESNHIAPQASSPEKNASYLVREIIEHEIDAQAKDESLWCYRKLEEKDGGPRRLLMVCQAKGAQIERLLAENGKQLDEIQQETENQRIRNLLHSKRELQKQERQRHEDGKQATELLELIPDAFVFQIEEKNGNKIKVKFTPNPAFHPSGHQAEVFYHMEGTLTLDVDQKRLAEISGRLKSPVKFGGGLLGHLDEGGTFLVRQQEVGHGCWEMTTMDVQMSGKALFFKTIDVRQKEFDSEFQSVPASATIEQAAEMTKDKDKVITAAVRK